MKLLQKYILYIAFAQALIATLGSLFFSEIMHFPPCVLCWYQRICMYPLVAIFAVGVFRKDKNVLFYASPLIAVGWLVALYHNLLYYHILPESMAPCVAGISCTIKFFAWFGFITIPLMSLTAFTILGGLMLIYRKKNASN